MRNLIHIAAELVAKAPADGHTVLYTLSLTVAGNPHLFSNLPYNVERDLTPITFACRSAGVLVVSTSIPAAPPSMSE